MIGFGQAVMIDHIFLVNVVDLAIDCDHHQYQPNRQPKNITTKNVVDTIFTVNLDDAAKWSLIKMERTKEMESNRNETKERRKNYIKD